MVEFGTSSAFRGWVRDLGYGFGVRGSKVMSRDCALASDLVRAPGWQVTIIDVTINLEQLLIPFNVKIFRNLATGP